VDHTLTERYAPPPAWRRRTTIVAVVVLAAAALAWLAWAAFVESTPKVHSQLVGWTVVDAHSASAQVDVSISGGTTHPTCTVQALASDHTIVGELRFTPTDGTNRVTVRTSRTATSVSLPGCIADGQDQPR
jgi:type 1 fimbria pilin